MSVLTRIHKSHETGLTEQTFRYLIATVISAALSLSLPLVFHEGLGILEESAVGISLCIVFVINFFTIRLYVFQSDATALPQFFKFIATSIAFRSGEYLLFLSAFRIFDVNYMVALIFALSISIIGKFIILRSFVFNQPS